MSGFYIVPHPHRPSSSSLWSACSRLLPARSMSRSFASRGRKRYRATGASRDLLMRRWVALPCPLHQGRVGDGVAGCHVALRDAPTTRKPLEFKVVAAANGDQRGALPGVGRLHLGRDVDLRVRPVAFNDDDEVAEAV